MARKSKDTIIKEQQKSLTAYNMYLEAINRRQNQLAQIIEDGYKDCISYYSQQEKLDFLNKLHDMDTLLYDSQKKQTLRLKKRLYSALQQLKQQGVEEDNFCDFQTSELYDQINHYKGKVINRDETIKNLHKEISTYQQRIAELQYSLNVQSASNDVKELKEQLIEKNKELDHYREQMQNLLIAHTSLLQKIMVFRDSPTITNEQLNEAVNSIIKNTNAQSPSDFLVTPSLESSDETQKLKDQITALEEELSELAAEKLRYGRPPKISSDDAAQILSLVQAGWSYRKIATTYGYSLGTISRTCQNYKSSI